MLWRLIKLFVVLIILAGLGLVAYAYVGPLLFPADFEAPSTAISTPITLDTN